MAVDYKALKNGGFMRQIQENRFSLRLKVVGGNLTCDQVETITAVAREFGDGHIHLTSRQGVEIPFIKLNDTEKVKAALKEGGVDTGTCGARVRTVTACQGSTVCPSGCIDTYPLAVAIAERYYGKVLPHKFKFGVTGCVNNCLKAEENDLGVKGGYSIEYNRDACTLCGLCVKACRDGALAISDNEVKLDTSKCNNCGRCAKACPTRALTGTPVYVLSFGGTFGNHIARGESFLPPVREWETLFKAADAALTFFEKHANPGERFRPAIDRGGWDMFREEIISAIQ
ncbi:hypothetical protein AGMMS49992_04150 [Clostridia bacterium]|nr:hypothetical protein AGMMS49992_04150 [Clostridia bacterium]